MCVVGLSLAIEQTHNVRMLLFSWRRKVSSHALPRILDNLIFYITEMPKINEQTIFSANTSITACAQTLLNTLVLLKLIINVELSKGIILCHALH